MDLTGFPTIVSEFDTPEIKKKILLNDKAWKKIYSCKNDDKYLLCASTPGEEVGSSVVCELEYADHEHLGLKAGHAYGIIKIKEPEDEHGKKHKLMMMKNPWGKTEPEHLAWRDKDPAWTPHMKN
jgi:hypothetical protein